MLLTWKYLRSDSGIELLVAWLPESEVMVLIVGLRPWGYPPNCSASAGEDDSRVTHYGCAHMRTHTHTLVSRTSSLCLLDPQCRIHRLNGLIWRGRKGDGRRRRHLNTSKASTPEFHNTLPPSPAQTQHATKPNTLPYTHPLPLSPHLPHPLPSPSTHTHLPTSPTHTPSSTPSLPRALKPSSSTGS